MYVCMHVCMHLQALIHACILIPPALGARWFRVEYSERPGGGVYPSPFPPPLDPKMSGATSPKTRFTNWTRLLRMAILCRTSHAKPWKALGT